MYYLTDDHIVHIDKKEYDVGAFMHDIILTLDIDEQALTNLFEMSGGLVHDISTESDQRSYATFKLKNDAKKFVKLFNDHLTDLCHELNIHMYQSVPRRSYIFGDGLVGTFGEIISKLEGIKREFPEGIEFEYVIEEDYGDVEHIILYKSLETQEEMNQRIHFEKFEVSERAEKRLTAPAKKALLAKKRADKKLREIETLERNMAADMKRLDKLKKS